MLQISRPINKVIKCLAPAVVISLLLAMSNSAQSQDLQQMPVSDHDIEVVQSPLQAQPFSSSGFGYSGLGLGRSAFNSIPYVGGIPHIGIPSIGIPSIGIPNIGIPSIGIPYVPSLSIPYVGGFGGFGGIGSLIGHNRYRSFGSSYSGYGLGAGYGLGSGFGTGFGSSYPAAYSWARPFGRLSSQNVIQTAPSKAAGNYYAPATVDPSAAGSYYASSGNENPRTQVFDKDYSDYRRSRANSYGNSDHTKPQKNYWGASGSPFPQDLNSTPWSK